MCFLLHLLSDLIYKSKMLKINYYGVLEENVGAHGISLKELENYKDLAKTAINSIYNVRANKMLGWIDLPDTDKKLIDEINTVATSIRNNFDNFVVLGIGGSALGTKALYQAFAKKHKAMSKQIYCTVCDNIDPDTFVTLLNELDLNKTMFNVITKSGGTSETLIQMRLVIDLYNKAGIDYKEHFIVTTESGNKLDAFAKANGLIDEFAKKYFVELRHYWSLEDFIKLSKKYISYSDFRKNEIKAYSCLSRHKEWKEIIKNIFKNNV